MNTAEQQAALAAKQKELDDREAALRVKEAAQTRTSIAEFAESLVTDGKLLPGQKAATVEILVQLEAANLVADFAAEDANHGKTGAALFRDFLSAMPKVIEFKRITQAGAETHTGGTADFAAPPGEAVDAEGLAIVEKANAYIVAHPGTKFIDAVKAVQAGK